MIEAVALTAVAAGILLSLACLVMAYADCKRSQRLVDAAVSALAEALEKRRRERVSVCAGSPPSPPSPEKRKERE